MNRRELLKLSIAAPFAWLVKGNNPDLMTRDISGGDWNKDFPISSCTSDDVVGIACDPIDKDGYGWVQMTVRCDGYSSKQALIDAGWKVAE